jgi:hypothetical protein
LCMPRLQAIVAMSTSVVLGLLQCALLSLTLVASTTLESEDGSCAQEESDVPELQQDHAMLQMRAAKASLKRPPKPSVPWMRGTWTTGYWDCCKPSCSWPGKGHLNAPLRSCDTSTGSPLQDANVRSVCDGGTAASCTNNAPFVIHESVSFGFAAAAVSGHTGLKGDAACGLCFELNFTSAQHTEGQWPWGGSHPGLAGKRMVVQVSNIGGDVKGDHSFDIQIPGAGQGIFSNGCAAQFPGFQVGDFDCDTRYGGCNDKSGCQRLPEQLREGCEWRYDWFHWLSERGQTNNPYVDFRRVKCPKQLVDISGSVADDDDQYPALDIEVKLSE